MEGFVLRRDLSDGVHPLSALATGLDAVPVLVRLVGGKTALARFVESVEVHVVPGDGYMWIDDVHGRLCVAQSYLREGPDRGIYVDLVHELVHIVQWKDGRELFDQTYTYVDRPTEIEAYRAGVEEARRIGMTEEEIAEYLRVDWVGDEDHRRLCQHCGVKPP
ncbi:MAG TPA: hypothetical protein VM681_09325 [Candidatus Thermoplasmatota archaeon]|nr:hypothetical protein [Candidatus Thermoplasmatota archaeon]